jgi:hypothetical protein
MNDQNHPNIPMTAGRPIATRGAETAARALKRLWGAVRR